MTQAQIETELRRNVVKIRSGFRGLNQLMRDKFAGEVPDETIDAAEAVVNQQIEAAIEQLTQAVRGEETNVR